MVANSQKVLLETHDYVVRVFAHSHDFLLQSLCEDDDVVVLDITHQAPGNFRLLDMFLNATKRPKLIVTTFDSHVFNRGDHLSGGDACILFKPFRTTELLSAIQNLRG